MKKLSFIIVIFICFLLSSCLQHQNPYSDTLASNPSFGDDVNSLNDHIDHIVGMSETEPNGTKPTCDELLQAHREGWLLNESAERRLRFVNSVHGSVDNEWLTKEREDKFYNMKLRYNWMIENVLSKCNHKYRVDKINRERISKYDKLPPRI